MSAMMRDDLHKLGRDALTFLDWWKDVLISTLPFSARAWLTRNGRQVTIRLERASVELDVVEKDGGRTFRDDRPLDALSDDDWEQLVALVADSRCSLVPEARHIWRTHLSLPGKATRDPRSAIALQLPLVSPLDPASLSWGYRISERTSDRLGICLVLARTIRLEEIADAFHQRGLEPPRIEAQTQAGPIILRGGVRRYRSETSKRNRNALLTGLLLLASVPLTIWLGARLILFINDARFEALRPRVAVLSVAARRAELAEAQRRAAGPLVRMIGAAPVIDDLAAALPDGVWIETLQMEGDRNITFRIRGQLDERIAKDFAKRTRLLSVVTNGPVAAADSGVDFTGGVR
jgi:hypothetical protein